MPDWRELVRERLGALGLGKERDEEVIAELADHFEDSCEERCQQGLLPEEAVAPLGDVSDWAKLRQEIRRAELEEDAMNQRTKSVWLPGLLTLTLSMGLLLALQKAGIAPRIIWLSPRSYLFLVLYWPWLGVLPFVGALGAFWSWRVGGGFQERVVAGVFPSAAMIGTLMAFFLPALVLDRHVPMALKATGLAVYLLGWGIIPAAALLLGTLPFLRGHGREPSPSND